MTIKGFLRYTQKFLNGREGNSNKTMQARKYMDEHELTLET